MEGEDPAQAGPRSGYVEGVKRGVYASRVGMFADTAPDPLLVASRLVEDYLISYHSALEAHGVAHTPLRRVTLLSARRPFRLEHRGCEFVILLPPRTLLGEWAEGIEEVLRSVGGFPSLNLGNVIAYLERLRSASTVARVGWVLSADPDLWRVTLAELERLRSRLGKGPYFLDRRSHSNKLVPEWRLYVPEHLNPAEELRS
jgi:predicted transcriptional regulator of viral defense system